MRTLVLCYHNIVREPLSKAHLEAFLAIPATRLAAHLEFLLTRYEPTTLDAVEGGDGGGRPGLIVTFDDGYRNVLTLALPLLQRLHIPAYVFVNPAFVGAWNPRDQMLGLTLWGSPQAVRELADLLEASIAGKERIHQFFLLRAAMWRGLRHRGAETMMKDINGIFTRFADGALFSALEPMRLLSWSDLRHLRSQGVRIANHTLHHYELDGLDRTMIRSEITAAQTLLVAYLGTEERVISYPRNKLDSATRDEAATAGYTWGLTTIPGVLTERMPTLNAPRIAVAPTDSLRMLAWKISSLRLWARGTHPAAMIRRRRRSRRRTVHSRRVPGGMPS